MYLTVAYEIPISMSENLEQDVLVFRSGRSPILNGFPKLTENALCSFTSDEYIFSVPYNLIPLNTSALNLFRKVHYLTVSFGMSSFSHSIISIKSVPLLLV